VEQAAVRPESTSVSTSDQHLPTRKRPAVDSIETLMRNYPNLKDPMSAKRKPTCDELQPIIQPSPESVPESTSVSVCPQTPAVSTSDKHLPTRKRPAVESIETLMGYCTNYPNLKEPMPAKRKPTCDELQPIIQPSPDSVPESTSVAPAATSVPLTPQGKDTEPGSDDLSVVHCPKVSRLIALVRARKSALNASRCTSVSGHGETTTSCASDSPESEVQGRLDPKYVETTAENPAPALEEKNSPLDGSSSARVDLLIGPTGAEAVGTMLPYASAADPSDPQHQRRVDAQALFANTSQSNPSLINCAVINHNAGHTPQPRGYWENLSTGAHQLPINTIGTMRSNQPEQQFIASNNIEDLTEVNRASLVTHSSSSVAEICPSDVVGGFGQYNQMVYVANQQSSYFSTDSVGSYTTQGNPHVHTGSSFQFEEYPTGGLYFPNQIHPDQETTCQSLQSSGNSLATQPPPEWVTLHQQLLLQQQRLVLQQQLLLQQQWQQYQ